MKTAVILSTYLELLQFYIKLSGITNSTTTDRVCFITWQHEIPRGCFSILPYQMPQPEVDRTIAAAMAVVRVHLHPSDLAAGRLGTALREHLCRAPEALLVPPG